nr:hypothetical protein [uncultured Flavobacterium sp.]
MNFKIKFPGGYRIENISNDNIDVNVITENGFVFFATFFTISNIQDLLTRQEEVYFWATDMIIITDLEIKTIRKAIFEIVNNEHLSLSFSEIGTIEQVYSNISSYEDVVCESID